MAKQIRAIFFDCDGVIIDSAADIADAVNKTLRALKLKTLSYEKLKSFVGNGAQTLIERSLQKSLEIKTASHLPFSQIKIEEITALYLKNYYAIATKKTKLYPGFKDALKMLKAAKIKTGIVTNKPSKILLQILKHFEIAKYFDVAIGADKVKNLKPAPDGIFLALEKINEKEKNKFERKKTSLLQNSAAKKSAALKNDAAKFVPILPCETIMVGDGYTDIAAGHAAGTLTAACLNGMGDRKKTLLQKPDIVLGYASEIAKAAILANQIAGFL